MDEPPTAQNVVDMLTKSFNRVYNGNRAPFGLYMHAGWFLQAWHYEGYKTFVQVLQLLNVLRLRLAELGISLFEIAQSLFALERTFILGAMVLLETKSGAH